MGGADALAEAIDQAMTALKNGDAVAAERLAKAVSAVARARSDAAAFASDTPPEEDEEAMRAELRRRIARFVEADLADAPPDVLERIAMGDVPA